MPKLPFNVKAASIGPFHDVVYLGENDDPCEELGQALLQSIAVDVHITIGETTMFLAAWMDPEHWASDWAEELGVDVDDAPAAAMAILEGAVEQ